MDAVAHMGRIIKETARITGGMGCAKLVVFANAVEDNPFMAGAFHGVGEPECVINVGVSGPGVVHSALQRLSLIHICTQTGRRGDDSVPARRQLLLRTSYMAYPGSVRPRT